MNSPTLRLGTWLSIGSPAIAELAGLCGFDWVLLDLEHGCETEAALPNQIRALRGSHTQAIVRVGAPHPDLISRVLDWGANGIMVPHVNSAAQAEATISWSGFGSHLLGFPVPIIVRLLPRTAIPRPRAPDSSL